jgi:hypothetical protein
MAITMSHSTVITAISEIKNIFVWTFGYIPFMKKTQRKMPGKKFVQPLRQRKKNRASKQQSANSLENA